MRIEARPSPTARRGPGGGRGRGGRGGCRGGGSTELRAFLGNDGILGVGAPEVAVIVLVGYFILGPTDLYKLTKEIGRSIQNFRTLSSEATRQFESTMEDQLELKEMRRAQRELTDAFSFRRSINTDDGRYFNEIGDAASPETAAAGAGGAAEAAVAGAAVAGGGAAGAAAGGGEDGVAPKKRRRKRRRAKRGPAQPEAETETETAAAANGRVPDLDVSSSSFETPKATVPAEAEAKPEATWFRDPSTMEPMYPPKPSFSEGEFDADATDFPELWGGPPPPPPPPAASSSSAAEQSRFAAQLSGDWNDAVLANEDILSPLGKIMERLAILEEEKRAADVRLEEEFDRRREAEERYYRERRALLEGAAAEVQADAYLSGADVPGGAEEEEKEKEKEKKAEKERGGGGGGGGVGTGTVAEAGEKK